MGWCSATEIIDTAITAADDVLEHAYAELGVDPDRVTLGDVRPTLDDVLRPFVSTLAAKLRDADWDCEQESAYFERFPQEMLGYDDRQYRGWLADQISDATGTDRWDFWVGHMAALNAKEALRGR